jgi:hypothetical protein
LKEKQRKPKLESHRLPREANVTKIQSSIFNFDLSFFSCLSVCQSVLLYFFSFSVFAIFYGKGKTKTEGWKI